MTEDSWNEGYNDPMQWVKEDISRCKKDFERQVKDVKSKDYLDTLEKALIKIAAITDSDGNSKYVIDDAQLSVFNDKVWSQMGSDNTKLLTPFKEIALE